MKTLLLLATLLLSVALANGNDYKLVNSYDIQEQIDKCQEYYRPDPLVVAGQASQSISPELISIDFGVETKDMEATKSLQNNANIVSKAIEALKQLNVLESEIKTTGLTISPQYRSEYDKNKQTYNQVFDGYKVNNQIMVRSKQLDKAGKMIDLAIKNGVTNVDNVYFDVPSKVKNQIRDELVEQAILNAKQKAERAVETLGYKIVSVKSINLSNNDWNYGARMNNQQYQQSKANFMADSESSNDSSTQVFGANQRVEVSVSVSFIIEKCEND